MTKEPQDSSPRSTASAARTAQATHAGSLIFSIALLCLIALALRGATPLAALPALIVMICIVATFHVLFRRSDLFSIVFANSVGVYACIYVVLVDANFPLARFASVEVAYVLPLIAFALGVLRNRKDIQHLIDHAKYNTRLPIGSIMFWAGPLLLIAAATAVMQVDSWTVEAQETVLISSMTAVSIVAALASQSIVLFLIECGVILRSFIANIVKLTRPAFALLTCYFLLTIIFACVFTIYSQVDSGSHFLINGTPSSLSFPDGLYLSIATLTTVGFGDIVATTSLGRLMVSLEVLCGVLLLLFGVEAMLDRRREN